MRVDPTNLTSFSKIKYARVQIQRCRETATIITVRKYYDYIIIARDAAYSRFSVNITDRWDPMGKYDETFLNSQRLGLKQILITEASQTENEYKRIHNVYLLYTILYTQ